MKRYILKLELDHITPSIWRRLIVPANISLDRLHDAIQISMGWFDYHLHDSRLGLNALRSLLKTQMMAWKVRDTLLIV